MVLRASHYTGAAVTTNKCAGSRTVVRLAVLLKVPFAGSYNSTLAIEPKRLPATMRTCPRASKRAVCRKRGVFRLPVMPICPLQGCKFGTRKIAEILGIVVFSGRQQDVAVPEHCWRLPGACRMQASGERETSGPGVVRAENPVLPLNPPEKSTFPLGRSVGSRPHANDMLPVTEKVPVVGHRVPHWRARRWCFNERKGLYYRWVCLLRFATIPEVARVRRLGCC